MQGEFRGKRGLRSESHTTRKKRTTPRKTQQKNATKERHRSGSGSQENRRSKSVAKTRNKHLRIPTPGGTRAVAIRLSRRSRQASILGKYWNAVHFYLQTGDASRLKKFRGKYITDVHRVRFPLLTDTDELDRLASAGVLSFESLYARSH